MKTNHAALVVVLKCGKTKPFNWIIISVYLRQHFSTSMMVNSTLVKDALELWKHPENSSKDSKIGSRQFHQEILGCAEH